MFAYVCLAILIAFVLFFFIIPLMTPKKEREKTVLGAYDGMKIWSNRTEEDEHKYPCITHKNESGTCFNFSIQGIGNLEKYLQNRAWMLYINEPLQLVNENNIISVKTNDDYCIGTVPSEYNRVLLNHISSYVDCYVNIIMPSDIQTEIPVVVCEAYFTDIFSLPRIVKE